MKNSFTATTHTNIKSQTEGLEMYQVKSTQITAQGWEKTEAKFSSKSDILLNKVQLDKGAARSRKMNEQMNGLSNICLPPPKEL